MAREPLQPTALMLQPLVERILAQLKALQEIAVLDLRRAIRVASLEHRDVHVHRAGVQIEGVALTHHDTFAQEPAQRGDALTEVVAGVLVAHPSPEQVGQLLATVESPRRQGQVGQESLGLCAADVQGLASHLQAESAQEQLQCRALPAGLTANRRSLNACADGGLTHGLRSCGHGTPPT